MFDQVLFVVRDPVHLCLSLVFSLLFDFLSTPNNLRRVMQLISFFSGWPFLFALIIILQPKCSEMS